MLVRDVLHTGLKVMNLHVTACEECQMPHCIPVGSPLGAMLDLPCEPPLPLKIKRVASTCLLSGIKSIIINRHERHVLLDS
jgi:hypothetical protein